MRYVADGVAERLGRMKPANFRVQERLVPNADLWMELGERTAQRPPQTFKMTTVKGHPSRKDVEEGRVLPEDKEGNDATDSLAVTGAFAHQQREAGAKLNQMVWTMSVQRMMVAILQEHGRKQKTIKAEGHD